MITSFIQGGLGNQLFQIAAGISLSKKLNVDFYLQEGLHFLPLQGSRIETYKNNILKNIKFADLRGIPFTQYKYDSLTYKEIPAWDNQMIIGYFQSEKYFEEHREYVKNLFYVPEVEVEPGTVAIHIRMGDYLKNPSVHPVLNFDYYNKALQIINNYSNVYVFTDSELPESFKFDKMKIIKSSSDYEDFFIMANCDYNIIANSTFSWWAAYLNKKTKKVIAPKTWFGVNGPQDWQDIYCDGWEII